MMGRMSPLIALAAGHGQGWRQVGDLLLAFALSSLIGLERQLRGKSAGLRTEAIVGTASALLVLVSKYGFADVLASGLVRLDPSRVAAQIVSGVGFLGAGLIIMRRGAIRGLTTAAAVWETSAIGMAAGAGLAVLAGAATVLHFVVVLGYTPLGRYVATRGHAERGFTVTYEDGRGVLRRIMATCTERSWVIRTLAITGRPSADTAEPTGAVLVSITLTLTGPAAASAPNTLATVDGVVRVDSGDDEE
jgi:putative Mg2+ transporter-C (MgtC) family protein